MLAYAENLPVLLREPRGAPFSIEPDVASRAADQELIGLSSSDPVSEFDTARIGTEDLSLDDDLLIVAGRVMVPAGGFHHRQEQALPTLQVLIIEPSGANKFYAPDFHPDQVIRVIHDTHLIGFRVAHAKARFMFLHGRFRVLQTARPPVLNIAGA